MRVAPLSAHAALQSSGPLPPWPPILAVRGPGSATSLHAHHAIHLMVSGAGMLRVRQSARGRWQEAAGVLTAPDALHSIDAAGGEVLLVFLDPESSAGAALATTLSGPVRLLGERERARLRGGDPARIMGAEGVAWVEAAVASLGGPAVASRPPPPPRLRRLLVLLQGAPPDADTSLAALAAAVGWSQGRLMHAFTESIGIPIRPYLAWMRLQRAAGAIVAGTALTDAAYAAGFADAAHMSRTFRRMFGISPSALRP